MPTTLGSVELARRLRNVLDVHNKSHLGLLRLSGTGTVVRGLLGWLEREDLTPPELKGVLEKLRPDGYLSQLLNLVSHRDMRRYLREKEIPWPFVLQNWEPSINDTGNFFAGVMVGAGEIAYDILILVVAIIGAPFSEELTKKRDEFWEAVSFMASDEFAAMLRQFVDDPAKYIELGYEAFKDEFEKRIWDLRFFDAGRMLGQLLAVVLTIIPAFKKLPTILRGLGRIVDRVAELSIAQIQRLGVSLKRLEKFIASPSRYLVTLEGFILVTHGDLIVIMDKLGKAVGKITKSKALQELGGQARKATFALKGIQKLSQAALAWLKRHKLSGLARRLLRPNALSDVKHLDECMDAINRFHKAQGFHKVAGSWLRGIRGRRKYGQLIGRRAGRAKQLFENAERGAAFVMRYCLAELSHLDPWTIVFESSVIAGGRVPGARATRLAAKTAKGFRGHKKVFQRTTDILLPGLKVEMKSVRGVTDTIINQLARDIVINMGGDLQRLKKLKIVFDRAALAVPDANVVDDLINGLRRHKFFRGDPKIPQSTYPKMKELEKILAEIVEIWP